MAEMSEATKTESPKLIECGDQETTGGWWTECSHCREETTTEDCWHICRTYWFFTKNNDGEPVPARFSTEWAVLVLALEHLPIVPQMAEMSEATKTESPKLIECGDQETTGGWWTECSHCREETTTEDCWHICGACGARWWEGDFVDFEG